MTQMPRNAPAVTGVGHDLVTLVILQGTGDNGGGLSHQAPIFVQAHPTILAFLATAAFQGFGCAVGSCP
jgi:hypothetical protein